MIVKAVGEDRLRAVAYLAQRLAMKSEDIVHDDVYSAFVRLAGDRPKGVVLYKNFSSGDIEMVCAGEPGWVTPGVLKFVFAYPFNELGCNRITCLAHRKNKAMRDYLVRMGFRLEGTKRKALNGADIMIYGMLKGENAWA